MNPISKILTYIFYGIAGIVVVVTGMFVASVGLETIKVAHTAGDYARIALTSVCLSLTCLVSPLAIYFFLLRPRKSPK